MEAATSLTALAVVLSAAVICGLFANRLRLPAAVGFILAGVVLGPTGFGLVGTNDAVDTLADLGVLMLLFIIGMELRLQSFRQLLPVALGVTVLQTAVTVGAAALFAQAFSVNFTQAIVIGFMMSISSTAVSMKMMEDSGEKHAPAGRLALAILIAQDLGVVPLLLVTQGLGAPEPALVSIVVRVVVAVALLVGFIAVLTRIKSFRFPFSEFFLRDTDIGTLGVLGLCFTGAAVSGLLGLSPALGAFLVGLGVGHSTLRPAALHTAAPVQSILLFTFFLSVGLLIDLDFIMANLLFILFLLVLAVVGRTLLTLVMLLLFRQPGAVAFPATLLLAPIGEFSFVLAATATAAGVLDETGHKVAITVIALSLLASPIWFASARKAHALVLRGITGLASLFTGTYGGELELLKSWSRWLAGASRAAAQKLRALIKKWPETKKPPAPPDQG